MGCRHKSKHKPRHHTHAIKAGSTIKGLIVKPAGETTAANSTPQAAPAAAETAAPPQSA